MSAPGRRSRGRGGRGGHEPRVRVRQRERRALELVAQGCTQDQIADELRISQPGVSKLLQRVERRLAQQLTDSTAQLRARQSLQFQYVYREAIHAWEASKAQMTRRRQRKTQVGSGAGSTVAELVTEDQHGDPQYLDVARKALSDLSRLLGLEAPRAVDLRTAHVPYQDWEEERLRSFVQKQHEALACLPLATQPGPSMEQTP